MKMSTLNDFIKEQLKDKKFANAYERELLINAIAKMIVSLRKNKKLTQAELAEKLGTSQSVIARLESGRNSRMPSLNLLTRIASATDTTINISFEETR